MRTINYSDMTNRDQVAELNAEFDRVWSELGRERKVVLHGVKIMATETPIRHSLGRKPEEIVVMPINNTQQVMYSGNWWQTQRPTDTAIYLQADAAMTADIVLKG